jgi:hypothetical protein
MGVRALPRHEMGKADLALQGLLRQPTRVTVSAQPLPRTAGA